MTFQRVTVAPDQMGGVPCIRGLRIPVSTIVSMVAQRMTEDEILAAYPDLGREDILVAPRYEDSLTDEDVLEWDAAIPEFHRDHAAPQD